MKSEERETIIYTGSLERDLIDRALKKIALEISLDSVNFSKDEKRRLHEMIHSDDPENFEVAYTIITNNLKMV